jgi:hypothetical protein
MPVGRSDPRRAILVAVAGLIAAGGLIGLILFVNSGDREVGAAGGAFRAGDADDLAEAIERDRIPILFPDPTGGDQHIYLQHLGDEDDEGWLAFDAQISGCAVDWDLEAQEFAACDDRRFPPDGEGLPQYEVEVDDGRVVIDFSPDPDPTTTTILRTGD